MPPAVFSKILIWLARNFPTNEEASRVVTEYLCVEKLYTLILIVRICFLRILLAQKCKPVCIGVDQGLVLIRS